MKYPEFKLETYLAAREFSAPYNLCASDLESTPMHEILALADGEGQALWDNLSLNYTEPQGHPLLREEIAKGYGPHIDRDQVLCFAGAEEGIYSMSHALLNADDHAIVVTPCYQSLRSVPESICPVTTIALEYASNWELDLNRLVEAVRPNTRLIVINYPHNPTGALLSGEKQQQLVEIARERGVWIFSDEVYRLMELSPDDRLPPIASIYERGMSLGVMSKSYGLAGLRIGWIACQEKEFLAEMNEVKHYLSICNSAPSEILALIAMRASTTILSRNAKLMKENLAVLDRFFSDHQDLFEWVRPKGGCIGYPLYKGEEPVERFADRLLEELGVLVLPSSVYDDPSNHFRISFGRRSMPQSLERLEKWLCK